jgi:hypothetical protein
MTENTAAPTYNPLKDVGRFTLPDGSEVRFYADEFKGYPFGSIRTFVKSATYEGPTKAGVTLKGAVLDGVIEALEKLPKEPTATEDVELARFEKKKNAEEAVELVVRITIFRDTTGVDLREWVVSESYTGWSKKGIRLPYAEVSKSVGFLKEMRTFLAGRPSPKKGAPRAG